jgi:hypothetical protein
LDPARRNDADSAMMRAAPTLGKAGRKQMMVFNRPE